MSRDTKLVSLEIANILKLELEPERLTSLALRVQAHLSSLSTREQAVVLLKVFSLIWEKVREDILEKTLRKEALEKARKEDCSD